MLAASFVATEALLVTTPAHAAGVVPTSATPAQKKDATDHFAAGKQAFESNDYATAISELQASIDVVDSPNTHLELARALRGSEDIASAWGEYRATAALAAQLAPQEPRYAKTGEVADTERADLETKLAFVVVSVAHAPAAATLTVAGRVVAPQDWNAPVVVSPGAVDVALIDSTGGDLAHVTVSALVGQTVTAPVEASPQPAVATLESRDDAAAGATDHPAPIEATTPLPPNPSIVRPLAYVSAGVGICRARDVRGVRPSVELHVRRSQERLRARVPLRQAGRSRHGHHGADGRERRTRRRARRRRNRRHDVLARELFRRRRRTPAAALVVGPGYIGMRGSL